MKKLITVIILFACFLMAYSQEPVRFKHILITNDDGVEDADRLFALAESVHHIADRVSIVVSSFDRSGTSNHTTLGKYQSTLEVTCEYYDEEKNIGAYLTPGNPGDCVLLGLNGLFPDDRPDLVLSGINGGPNIGPNWFGSGTIGAARMGAFLGVRSIAISGFYGADERSFQLIPQWITQFISSGILEEIDKNAYITIGIPKISLDEIKGVKIKERRAAYDWPERSLLTKIHGGSTDSLESTTIWSFTENGDIIDKSKSYDDTWLEQGYILITPMSIDENNRSILKKMQAKEELLPKFSIH